MIGFDCDATRDLLPLLHRGECSSEEARTASAHLELCAECRQERELVRILANAAQPVPAGLEARVLAAVGRRAAPRRWTPSRMAVAAAVAATVLGGTLTYERWLPGWQTQERAAVLVLDDSTQPAVSWAVTEDALLHSGTPLQQLSVEQLEQLLAELDS
jgi:predicted anti-sigma-YlaC factor YlaD